MSLYCDGPRKNVGLPISNIKCIPSLYMQSSLVAYYCFVIHRKATELFLRISAVALECHHTYDPTLQKIVVFQQENHRAVPQN